MSDNKRGPGRPRNLYTLTPKQKRDPSRRRINKSGKGRGGFIPGLPHVLDSELEEARRLRAELSAEIDRLFAKLVRVNQALPGASQFIDEQESALKRFIWQHYRRLKHRDHLIALLLIIRRRRELARLQAARVALELAAELLAPDTFVLDQLREAVLAQQELEQFFELARAEQQDSTPPRRQKRGTQQASLRVYGRTKEEIRDMFAEYMTRAHEAVARIEKHHLYGDADATRRRLDQFNDQIRILRTAMRLGTGWREQHYVKKLYTTLEAKRYLARGEQVPDDVPVYEGVIYGPYAVQRWQEESGPIYSVQLGSIPAKKLDDAEMPVFDESGEVPWVDL